MHRTAGRLKNRLDHEARAVVAFFGLALLAMILVFGLTVVAMLFPEGGATVAVAASALVTFLGAVAAVVRTYLRGGRDHDDED